MTNKTYDTKKLFSEIKKINRMRLKENARRISFGYLIDEECHFDQFEISCYFQDTTITARISSTQHHYSIQGLIANYKHQMEEYLLKTAKQTYQKITLTP